MRFGALVVHVEARGVEGEVPIKWLPSGPGPSYDALKYDALECPVCACSITSHEARVHHDVSLKGLLVPQDGAVSKLRDVELVLQ